MYKLSKNLKSKFSIQHVDDNTVLIKDLSNQYNKYISITNDAENVVEYLTKAGILNKKRRLFYIDTEGDVDELVHDGNGTFIKFKTGFNNEDEFYRSING